MVAGMLETTGRVSVFCRQNANRKSEDLSRCTDARVSSFVYGQV